MGGPGSGRGAMRDPRKRNAFYIYADVLEKVREVSKRTGKPMRQIIEEAIESMLEKGQA